MKKKKFPEINYSFMEKSSYKRKKKKTFLYVIIGLVVVIVGIYLGLYLYDRYGDRDLSTLFNREKDIKEEEIQEKSPINIEDTKELDEVDDVEEDIIIEADEPEEEEASSPEIQPRDMITYQMALYGLRTEDTEDKLKEFMVLTGEDFRTSYMFNSSEELIPEEIISSLTREEASVLRNEIYARHGYPFGKGSLSNYFNLKDWYQSRTKNVQLNEVEKQNVSNIYSYERSKGWK